MKKNHLCFEILLTIPRKVRIVCNIDILEMHLVKLVFSICSSEDSVLLEFNV